MQQESAPQPTLGMGLAVWIGTIVAVAGFVAIGFFLHLVPLYAGFLLVWYWAVVEKGALRSMPATFVGAICGIATAGLLQYATVHWGPAGAVPVLLLIAAALLVQIMNWLPIAINPPYMLFLTVATAPLLQGKEDFGAVALTLLVGCVYFCGLAYVIGRIAGGGGAPAVATPRS